MPPENPLTEIGQQYRFETSDELTQEDREERKSFINSYLTQNDVFHTEVLENYEALHSPSKLDAAHLAYMYDKALEVLGGIINEARQEEEEERAERWQAMYDEMIERIRPRRLKKLARKENRINREPRELTRVLDEHELVIRQFVNFMFQGTKVTSEGSTGSAGSSGP